MEELSLLYIFIFKKNNSKKNNLDKRVFTNKDMNAIACSRTGSF